ncbi:hypothetical protein J7384_17005 [Endozoicomonas sp. G2_1]|uniref:hypothetical protein n=1 Tax=Endozoicomonas sp. G2_1 TaxID=2821091 RepID=UPI001AD9F413|nr:hypothetical protein [Endozoicomonas sp. G2_1]MBO9492063.1 hypothetical protein [Endozoicomonas sp. G2_1]
MSDYFRAVREVAQQNQYNTYGYVNPNDEHYASRTYANLINRQYADYRSRFLPYERRLMELADSTQLLDEQLSRVTTNVNQAYNDSSLQQRMMNERYGLTQTYDVARNTSRHNDVNRALSMAHAKNNTRIADSDRRNDVLTGASTSQQTFTNRAGG